MELCGIIVARAHAHCVAVHVPALIGCIFCPPPPRQHPPRAGAYLRRLWRAIWVIVSEYMPDRCVHALPTYCIPPALLPYSPFGPLSFTTGALVFRTQYSMAPRNSSGQVAVSDFVPMLAIGDLKTAVALGPSSKIPRRREVILLGVESMVFNHVRSQKNKDHPRWQANYNGGEHGEHLFVPLYNWAVCRDPSMKLGMHWEQSLLFR